MVRSRSRNTKKNDSDGEKQSHLRSEKTGEKKAREELFNLSYGANEAEIQRRITNWLDAQDIPAEIQYPIGGGGAADIHLLHRRCIIETKTTKKLSKGPYELGTGSDTDKKESAFRQLSRYVEYENKQDRLDGIDVRWFGIVTDSKKWWIWIWPQFGTGGELEPGWDGKELDENNIWELKRLIDNEQGKPWTPENLPNLFKDKLKILNKLYERKKDMPATVVQKKLWLEQLKGGGNNPNLDDENKLFVAHTLLILISRIVSRLNLNETEKTLQRKKSLIDGFVGWVSTSKIFVNDLEDMITQFEWGRRRGDVLRRLYEFYIPKKQRRRYGEYYTPDWLAEYICHNVISESYIEKQIQRFKERKPVNGILDPACGSGTFLLYAAKRIISSDALSDSVLGKNDKIKFICKVINGIDIHPVAVEMAIANIRRAIPGSEPAQIRIYQGDSLLLDRPDSNLITGGKDNITLYSPDERPITLPLKFIKNGINVVQFVEEANEKKSNVSKSFLIGLNEKQTNVLKKGFAELKTIINSEGNGVWAWYIRNQAAPLFMSDVPNVGIILSNPPWVRNSEIINQKRKNNIRLLAKDSNLWAGGKNATNFDIAGLFAIRCMKKYMIKDGTAAWVLPQSAIFGAGQWEKLRNKLKAENYPYHTLDVGNLPFKEHGLAGVFFIKNGKNKKMVLKEKQQHPKENEQWFNIVQERILMKNPDRTFEDKPSGWVHGKKLLLKNGATIFPVSFVCISTYSIKNDKIEFKTKEAKHGVWKTLGSQSGIVPVSYVKDCYFSAGLIPFTLVTTTKCIMPFSNGWIRTRNEQPYWKDISAMYRANKGPGATTPTTMEERLDHQNSLSSQFKESSNRIVYNKSGSKLVAAILPEGSIIANDLYRVFTNSINESYFLLGILNSECLQEALTATKISPRHYDTHFWRKIPIPRYVPKNKAHSDLVKYSKKAEKTAIRVFTNGMKNRTGRNTVQKALVEEGISKKINACVVEILPAYT